MTEATDEAGSPYERVRVDETRIRRVYDHAAIVALIRQDLLGAAGRASVVLRESDRLVVDFKAPVTVEAELILPGAGW